MLPSQIVPVHPLVCFFFLNIDIYTTVHASRYLYRHRVIMRLTLVGLPWHWCSGVPAGPGPPSSCLTVEHSQLVIHAICAHLLLFTSQVAEDSVYRWHLNDKLRIIILNRRIRWSAVSVFLYAAAWQQHTHIQTHTHLIVIINRRRKMFLQSTHMDDELLLIDCMFGWSHTQ